MNLIKNKTQKLFVTIGIQSISDTEAQLIMCNFKKCDRFEIRELGMQYPELINSLFVQTETISLIDNNEIPS